jgi:terminase small subunit-like protein
MPNDTVINLNKPSRTPKRAKPRYTTKRLKKRPARSNGKHPGGRPTAYRAGVGNKVCALVASGDTLRAACVALKIPEDTVYGWLSSHDEFRQTYAYARHIRADMAFGEQILDIADDSRNDWLTAKTGRQIPNKELVLRSKLRIEAREFHMSRLHPQTWGDRQKIDLKSDWSLLTDEERRRKAEELIAMIRELREPPPEPPPLVYRAEETTDETDTGDGIGWQPRSATGPDG